VVVPQAMRIVIPPLTSQYLNLTKNSSLAIAIGYPDLTATAGTVLNQTGQAVEGVVIMMVDLSGHQPSDLACDELVQRQDGAGGEDKDMQEHDMSWVRTEMALAQPAPAGVTGLGAWVRKNLIASAGDTMLTIVGIALVVMILPQIINWAFVNAVWTGPDRTVCATVGQGGIQPDGWSGACWAFVNAKFGQFMFGTLSDRGALAADPGRHPVRGSAGADADPESAAQGAECPAAVRCFADRAFFLLVGGMFGLPACRDRAVGRACW
jgi:hypothetical protein